MNKFGVVVSPYKDQIIQLYSQAHNLVMRNDYARALELLDRIAADVPGLTLKTSQIGYERALCLKALGRVHEAEEMLRSCLSVRPDDPNLLGLFSEIQFIKEEIDPNRGLDIKPTVKEAKSAEEIRKLWNEVKTVLPLVREADIGRALRAISLIEEQMIGRHCGNLGDKLLQYLSVVQFVRATGSKTIDSIEIGTLFGGSCLMKLLSMRDLGVEGKVVCIDPMSGYYGQQIDPKAGIPVTAEVFFRNIDSFGFSRESIDLREVKSNNPRAIMNLRENSYGTLMIDGDHCYGGVRYDWENYSRFVRWDGIVSFDDYASPSWPDIAVFVNELRDSLSCEWRELGRFGRTFVLGRAFEKDIREAQKIDKNKIYEGLNKCYFSERSSGNTSGTGFRPTVYLESVAPGVRGERRISQALELCNYGGALAKEGEYVEALAFLEQIPIEYPDIAGNIADLQFSRAVCLRALGRFNEAETAIREELALAPQHPYCHELLSDIQRERQSQDFICDTPVFVLPAKSTILCELCGIKSVYFERQFDRDWYICPNCNLLRSNVNESEAKVLDNGSPSGSKSSTYSVAHRREEFFCRLFLKQLKLNDILLYGVGWSPVYKNLRETGYNVVGCDLWRALIEQRNKEFGLGSFYHRDDLPDAKFDVISAFEVFEHFVRPVQEVQILANHLKNNGIIVGCTDFWHGGSLREHPNPDKSYWAHKSHVTAWTWKSMNAVAHQFGLKTYYCKTNKRNFAAKVFFVMYKGDKYEWFVRGLPKIFYDVW